MSPEPYSLARTIKRLQRHSGLSASGSRRSRRATSVSRPSAAAAGRRSLAPASMRMETVSDVPRRAA